MLKHCHVDESYINSGKHCTIQSEFLHEERLQMTSDAAQNYAGGIERAMSSMITRSPTSNGCVLFV
jgi:hypothetical protein